jgi:hypothetical protein
MIGNFAAVGRRLCRRPVACLPAKEQQNMKTDTVQAVRDLMTDRAPTARQAMDSNLIDDVIVAGLVEMPGVRALSAA